MAKGYRNQALPGIKKCIDYMKGKTVKEEKSTIKDVPPQSYKSKK